MKGIVKWYNDSKGFGFITGEDEVEYFAHFTSITEGLKFLKEDEEVTFTPSTAKYGVIATDIVRGQQVNSRK